MEAAAAAVAEPVAELAAEPVAELVAWPDAVARTCSASEQKAASCISAVVTGFALVRNPL